MSTRTRPAVIYDEHSRFNHENGVCGVCGNRMSAIVEGDATAAFCPICRTLDMQAINALIATFAFVATERLNFTQTTDPAFSEFRDPDPFSRPPLPFDYVRLWSFEFSTQASISYTPTMVLVALRHDGTYHVDYNTARLCFTVQENVCWNYLHPTAEGIYACPEHGPAPTPIA